MKSFPRALPFAICAAWLAWAATPSVDPNLYLNDVKFLASQGMRGRATGSPELEKAAAFIAGDFRQFGIQPADGRNYLQPFDVTTSATPGKNNRFTVTDDGKPARLEFGRDFTPLDFSHSGRFSGSVIFAGYGITAPEYHYDDYAGLDVKGKIVLILRHEPQEMDEHSVFAGRALTRHAEFASKASNAKMHGAAAVILINDLPNHPGHADKLDVFGASEGPDDAGIPFVQLTDAAAEHWFQEAGKPLDGLVHSIDRDLQPESFTFPTSLQIDASVDLERLVKTVHNVAAYLPGTTAEYVIVGAHYDHLGLGGQYSLAPSMTGTVHPGADDNASGTAGVLELARWFAVQPKRKRGILFLTFAGEEMGLLGSEYWAGHPQLPLANAVAMINMDMIGRLRDGKLYVGGLTTGTTFRAMLDRLTAAIPALHVDYSEGPEEESSDHASFLAKGIPSLFFFSGLHSDYHKPGDTWEKINAPGAAEVLQLAGETVEELREAPDRPQFVKPAPAAHGGTDPGPVSGASGYGPWFGSVPDFGGSVNGVKFADVTAGSPAAKAGLRAGDVLVEFDAKPIGNLYDFTYALRAKKPGDQVQVKVLRDGKPLEVSVVLEKR
jgi:Peptidase family M28/PDZ domain/PA domain